MGVGVGLTAGAGVSAGARSSGALEGDHELVVRDLTWRPFGRRDPILDHLDLDLAPGERVLLAGPSGSGKSTLLRALAGVLTSTDSGELSGSVTLGGRPVLDQPTGEVGLLLQDPADAMVAGTVGREVAFGPENAGLAREQIWERVEESLRLVGFPYGIDHEVRALSGGEAQRLALAGVLALRPAVLLLDEPCSMLDPASAATVRDAVAGAVGETGATLVVVEHQLSHWTDLVDRLVVLDHRGQVVADGPVADVLTAERDRLLELGVWVPGAEAPAPLPVDPSLAEPAPGAGGVLVRAEDVGVVRTVPPGLSSWQVVHDPVVALAGADAEVRAGSVLALRGASGAGKSTLAAVLAGLLEPTSGMVTRMRVGDAGAGAGAGGGSGGAAGAGGASGDSAGLAAGTGWCPQNPEIGMVGRTVLDDVCTTGRALGLDEAWLERRAQGLLGALGLGPELWERDPHTLSGGEQRRLALASSIAHGPGLLALDEPTVGQDRSTWSAVRGVITAARDGGTAVVLATHDAQLAEVADDQVVLERQPAGGSTGAGGSTDAEGRAPRGPAGGSTRPGRRVTSGLAARSGPLAVLLASVIPMAGAPFLRDWRTAAFGLVAFLVVSPLVLGRRWPQPLHRLTPVLIGVLSLLFSNWWLSPDRDLASAALPALRLGLFAAPAVLLMAYLEPFPLGDHLGQRLRVPGRPLLAAVAALQRFDSLVATYAELRVVRRVRGIAPPRRSVVGQVREAASLTFALLVHGLRQAARMAVAMEARGFSLPVATGRRRTWAQPAPWRGTDTALVGVILLVTALTIGVGVAPW